MLPLHVFWTCHAGSRRSASNVGSRDVTWVIDGCPSYCNKSTNSRSPCHSHPAARQKLDAVSPFTSHLSLLTFTPRFASFRVSRAPFQTALPIPSDSVMLT